MGEVQCCKPPLEILYATLGHFSTTKENISVHQNKENSYNTQVACRKAGIDLNFWKDQKQPAEICFMWF